MEKHDRRYEKIFLVSSAALILLIVIAGSVFGTLWYVKRNPERVGISVLNTQKLESESEQVLKELGTLISLPDGEVPTVATVTDVEKIKAQPFFKNAQNEDKVIIYSNSKKVILYRPSQKKIIDVGTVNIRQSDTTQNEPPVTP